MSEKKTKPSAKNSGSAHAGSDNTAGGSAFLPVEPFDIVVFGATGDLARRKLLPSLFHRFCDGQIAKTSKIIGVSRSAHSRESFQKLIEEAYHKFSKEDDFDPDQWSKFSALLHYHAIDVLSEDADWGALAGEFKKAGDKTRVFYLAMPPRTYARICEGLDAAGIAAPHSRVVLEKPIGTDYDSALAINEGVGKVFDENRIYRIDHYLGKETVQNLLVLRFANILLEPLWSHAAIEHVQITAAESIGVGGRGAYYDEAGALRDMVQNHLLQLLCLTAMEAPASLDADDVRTEKLKVLRALRGIESHEIEQLTVRGQYARGKLADGHFAKDYLTDVDVDQSSTESYVALTTYIDNWRWAGVPFYLRTGKRMASRRSEIVIQFKSVPHSVFGQDTKLNANRLVIRLQPDEAVTLWMDIKEPGAGGMRLKTLPLNLSYAENFAVRYPDAYERLLMDVVRGNLSLFMRRDEVEAAWQWVDKVHAGWTESDQRVELYPAGEDGPREGEDMLARSGHTWFIPQAGGSNA
jgi:glucose-6-phosphate 1-dehydrogenase